MDYSDYDKALLRTGWERRKFLQIARAFEIFVVVEMAWGRESAGRWRSSRIWTLGDLQEDLQENL